jgi:hypothetical protein
MPVEITVAGASRPVTAEVIRELQSETGVTLPEGYRAFLLKHNGGTPNPDGFTSKDKKLSSFVTRLAPMSDEDEYNLQGEIERITEYRYIPSDMIPIGIDPVKNRIVLVVSGPDTGKVFYWAWDEEPETPTCSRKYMRLLADSFDEFLASLHAS